MSQAILVSHDSHHCFATCSLIGRKYFRSLGRKGIARGEGGRERVGCLTSAVRVTLAGGIELTKAGGGNIFSNSCCDVIFAFDEGERILIVSFLRKSLSRVLWTSPKGITRDALQFQPQAFMCKCCLGRLELKTPNFLFDCYIF